MKIKESKYTFFCYSLKIENCFYDGKVILVKYTLQYLQCELLIFTLKVHQEFDSNYSQMSQNLIEIVGTYNDNEENLKISKFYYEY